MPGSNKLCETIATLGRAISWDPKEGTHSASGGTAPGVQRITAQPYALSNGSRRSTATLSGNCTPNEHGRSGSRCDGRVAPRSIA